jgi:crossover junction endonuclease MUS81
MLLIKVDFREKDLIALLQLMNDSNDNNDISNNNSIKIKVDNLKIGDVAFVEIDKNENEIGDELLLFERKSLNDLASSIKDGRYAEQSFRLDGYEHVPNHNIVYLIEGDLSRYRENKFSRINKKTLLSSMFSILYYKGFSVVRSMNVVETSELIWSWADKLEREMGGGKKSKSGSKKMPYYKNDIISTFNSNSESILAENKENSQFHIELELEPPQENEGSDKTVVQTYDYCSVLKVKKEKNANVTPENIGVIMLSTIPGISSKTAIVIMNEFKTIGALIKSFELNPHCLNKICIETNGKSRKITSTCIENIRKYLLNV